MKALSLAAASMLVAANAAAFDWSHGRWSVEGLRNDSNSPICFLTTEYNQAGLSLAVINDTFRIIFGKEDWRIRRGEYRRTVMWSVNGKQEGPFDAYANEDGKILVMDFDTASTDVIMEDLADGLHLHIALPNDDWHMPLYGSANAINALRRCIDTWMDRDPMSGAGHSPV